VIRKAACLGWILLLCGCRTPAFIPPPDPPADTSAAPAASPPEGTGGPAVEERKTALLPSAESAPPETITPAPDPTAALDRSSVSLAFVGDIMLGRSLAARIARGDGGTIFASVEPILQSADLAVGNLECALGEGGIKAPKAYAFRAPPEAAPVLREAGFDLLSLANNHSLDYGAGVLEQTMKAFDMVGIRYVGAGTDAVQAHAPVFLDRNGFRLAFLAYVDVSREYSGFDPKIWNAGPASPGVSWAEDEKIKRDLQQLDPQADFIIVLFHFGDEGEGSASQRQILLSRLAIDSGADLIVGSHPHVLQAAEEYHSRWIFYSLGNFVFDEFSGESNRSAILWIVLSRDDPLEYSLLLLNIVDGIPVVGE
jgi:poly-gamma-glutamate capsule biosynthesis protein CapA/YwtB (metallophosphatase superfamily)